MPVVVAYGELEPEELGNLWDDVSDAASSAVDAGEKAASDTAKAVGGAASDAASALVGAAGDVAKAAGSVVTTVTKPIGRALSPITNLIGSAASTLNDAYIAITPTEFRKAAGWGVGLLAAGATYGAAGAAVNVAAGKTIANVLSGEDLEDALKHAGRATLAEFKTAAPFIQLGLSFIPGVGQSAAAALGAAIALAEGRPISDLLIALAAGAVPGGALAQRAFEVGAKVVTSLAAGKSLDAAALDAARAQLPDAAAQAAFDTAVALAYGKNLQEAGLAGAKDLVPGDPYAQAAFAMTQAALRGDATPATLVGAAAVFVPNAPGAKQLGDDAYGYAKELADQGAATVRDVHTLGGQMASIGFDVNGSVSSAGSSGGGGGGMSAAMSAPPDLMQSAGRGIRTTMVGGGISGAFRRSPAQIAAGRFTSIGGSAARVAAAAPVPPPMMETATFRDYAPPNVAIKKGPSKALVIGGGVTLAGLLLAGAWIALR